MVHSDYYFVHTDYYIVCRDYYIVCMDYCVHRLLYHAYTLLYHVHGLLYCVHRLLYLVHQGYRNILKNPNRSPKVYQKLIIFLILCSAEAYMGGKKAKTCLSKFDIKFLVFVYF